MSFEGTRDLHRDHALGVCEREAHVPVHLWHGVEDTPLTMSMARHLAERIPNRQARFVPNAAHLLLDEPSVVADVRRLIGRDEFEF